jgi:DNA-binding SARP family transcriptional activator
LSQLSIALLGRTQILLDGRAISFRTNKVQALLCYMLVEAINQPGVAFRREALLEMLWPDMPLKSAQDNLRQTLYQLKKAIPETAVEGNSQPFILSDRVAVRINPDAIYILDVAQFEEVTGSFSELVKLEKAAAL